MRQYSIVCAIICVFFAGCAPELAQDVPGMDQTRAALVPDFKKSGFYGLEATLKLDAFANATNNLIFTALYIMPGDAPTPEHAKFVLTFPNGGKIGQCERLDRSVECTGLPFSGSESIVKTAFMAIDGLVQGKNGHGEWAAISPAAAPGYNFDITHGNFKLSVLITRIMSKK